LREKFEKHLFVLFFKKTNQSDGVGILKNYSHISKTTPLSSAVITKKEKTKLNKIKNLFSRWPWNQVNWRKGEMIGRASHLLRCPVHH